MTAEIAILNKSAVALAADSAVTFQVGAGQKIYNTVNKLFTLSKYRPIGVMIYGNSEFMGVPWESIIKEHRRGLRRTEHGTLREYVDGFVAWISTAKLLFPPAVQDQFVNAIANTYFLQLKQQIEQIAKEAITGKTLLNSAAVAQIVRDVIDRQRQRWTKTARLSTVRADFETKFAEKHRNEIETARAAIFQTPACRPRRCRGVPLADCGPVLPRFLWSWRVRLSDRGIRSR
jgi:hypothetical protein